MARHLCFHSWCVLCTGNVERQLAKIQQAVQRFFAARQHRSRGGGKPLLPSRCRMICACVRLRVLRKGRQDALSPPFKMRDPPAWTFHEGKPVE